LPLPFDLVPILKRFFNVRQLGTLDAANPLPPRVLLPDSEGAPPPGWQVNEPPPQLPAEEIRAIVKRLSDKHAASARNSD
jgi:hypothetical protein